jgi:hypothetical protein
MDGFAASSSSCFNFSRRSRCPLRTTYFPSTRLVNIDKGGRESLTDLVGDLGSQPLLVNHLLPDIVPRHLVELVHGRGDGADEVVGHAADLEEAVEDLARVELDGVFPLPAKALEDLVDDPDLLTC